jgi:hypothetical protein
MDDCKGGRGDGEDPCVKWRAKGRMEGVKVEQGTKEEDKRGGSVYLKPILSYQLSGGHLSRFSFLNRDHSLPESRNLDCAQNAWISTFRNGSRSFSSRSRAPFSKIPDQDLL